MITLLLWGCDTPDEPTPKEHTTTEIPIPTQQRHQFDDCQQSHVRLLEVIWRSG